MTEKSTGFGYMPQDSNNQVDIKTVSDTIRAVQVNALLLHAGHMSYLGDTDRQIAETFKKKLHGKIFPIEITVIDDD